MDVAGGNHGLTELVGNGYNLAVYIFYILDTGYLIKFLVFVRIFRRWVGVGVNHKTVVAYGLNFEIVVKRRYLHNLLFGAFLEYSAVKLARLARRADYKPLAVFHYFALWHSRLFVKIVYIGL